MYNYGWICPKCGRVLSPTTTFCPCCGGNNQIYCSDSTNKWYTLIPPDEFDFFSNFNKYINNKERKEQ